MMIFQKRTKNLLLFFYGIVAGNGFELHKEGD
jgi:hypothetical protein